MTITVKKKAAAKKSDVKLIAAKKPPAIAANALEIEDEFTPFYMGGNEQTSGHILRPPYEPRQLEQLTQTNNTLGCCVEAMIVNIDGTGHDIEKINKDVSVDEEEEDDPTAQKLEAFFAEPYPGVSFVTIRRDLRRDLERTGNAYLEVMRSIDGEIVFVRHVPARTIRLVKLDKAVPVTKSVSRNGKEATYEVMMRERRYVQMMAGQLMYFREFGSSRDLDKWNGRWNTESPVEAKNRATELLHFQLGQDPNSPYGTPRWDGQIPSVLGSRRAEEQNLVYLESGGMPPALIVVQGGAMAEDARKALEKQFSPGAKHRAAILEVHSTSGSLDQAGQVKVSVERFGAERMNDAMFESYDEKCYERVLRAFRLPPMFVGAAADYAFASAYASYLVAEAQVFGPERLHFDEIITKKLLPALGGSGYEFKSKPINIKDVQTQITALQLASGLQGTDPKSVIDELNTATDLNIQFSEGMAAQVPGPAGTATMEPTMVDGEPTVKLGIQSPKAMLPGDQTTGAAGTSAVGTPMGLPKAQGAGNVVPFKKADDIGALADRVMVALRLRKFDEMERWMGEVGLLTPDERSQFDTALAARQFLDSTADPEGLAELASCTAEILNANPTACN